MLNRDISSRLRAGAHVVLVEEHDELIARKAAEFAAKQFMPCVFASAADADVLTKIEAHKSGSGTLVLSDVLRAHGQNPVVVRLIREIALQERETPSRLILLEVPGVNVPESLKSDIEFIQPKMPTIKELKSELDDFVRTQNAKLPPGNGEVKHEIAASVAGLPRHEAFRLFCRVWAEKEELDVVWLRREKANRITERYGGALTFIEPDCPDVGGADILKGWLAGRKSAFLSEAARKYGLPEPKGLLLLGAPGNGKSLTAKTISRAWGLPLLRLDSGKLFGSLVGQSEAQTRQAIEAVEACAPCILWIDEIEKGFGQGGLDGGTSQRVFGTLLTWLQEKQAAVFVVATANSIKSLPPEMLRKGRFDEIFFVDLPNVKERLEIARIHLLRRGRDPEKVSAERIAKETDGFSGAEIEQVIIDALFTAYADKAREVTTKDVLDAVKATVPLSKTMKEQLTELREWAGGRAKMASSPLGLEPDRQLKRTGVAA